MKPLLKNKTILMMGAPGTGKGSYSKKISKRFGIPVYSTGDHLRDIINNPNLNYNKLLIEKISNSFSILDVPKYLNDILSKGELISKEIMQSLILFTLDNVNKTENNSIILDGYPRTISQAKEFDTLYKRPINLVLNVEQHKDIIIKKLLGRRQCSNCPSAYNVTDINENGYNMPSLKPKKENICNLCGSDLYKRSDDTEAIISERLKIYDEKSKDILEYYQNKNTLRTVEMKKGFDDIGLLYNIVESELINKNI